MVPERFRLLSTTRLFAGTTAVYHIAHYHAPRAGYQDKVSRSIHDFRDRHEPELGRWISVARAMVPRMVKPDLIVRVLASEETVATGLSPIDMLCEALSEETGASYVRERLKKSHATSQAQDAANRAARKQELADAYHFDAAGLPRSARVLVVDDIAVTGSSLEAVACAIKASLQNAEVICFVLGRADGLMSNCHLHPQYFTTTGPLEHPFLEGPAPAPAPGPMTPVRARLADRMTTPRTTQKNVASAKRENPLKKRLILGGSILALLVAGVLVPLRYSRDAMATEENVVPPAASVVQAEDHAYVAPENTAPTTSTAPEFAGPLGVVTVPGVNLRSDHVMSGRIVPRSALRSGETVSIVRRHTPGDGPSWLQVRTRGGKTGWLIASLVNERKDKRAH
jgi:predicted amidophosphoribosyltransferase